MSWALLTYLITSLLGFGVLGEAFCKNHSFRHPCPPTLGSHVIAPVIPGNRNLGY